MVPSLPGSVKHCRWSSSRPTATMLELAMRLFMLILTLNCTFAFAAQPNTKFTLVDSDEEEKTYEQGDLMVTSKSDPLKLADIKNNPIAHLQKTFEKRAELLTWIGITDWVTQKTELTPAAAGKQQILLRGTYRNGSNTLIYFTEIYLVSKTNSKLYLATSDKAPVTPQQLEQIVKLE